MEETLIKVGQVLLAEPFMWDTNFKRSAILLCEHHPEGSLGFILNKPLEMKIDELVPDFPEFDSEVYFGGPVQTDTVHYLHDVGHLLDDSVEVVDGIYWSGDYEKLKALAQNGLIQPHNIRFFVGYSGWSEGQLLEEIKDGSWVIAEMFANYLFQSDPDQLWAEIMAHKGDCYSVIGQIPDEVNWN